MKPKQRKSAVTCRHKRQTNFRKPSACPHHPHTPLEDLNGNYNNYGRQSSSEFDSEEDDDIDTISSTFSASCTVKDTKADAWNAAISGGAKKKQTHNGHNNNDGGYKNFDDLFEESVRENREQLVSRLRIYNNLLQFHKDVKEDQVFLYRRLQNMDELYLRNTAAILRLGFCHCLVHRQTSPVGDKLMKIHRKLRIWDKKVEDLCEVVKVGAEPSTRKTATSVLDILNICETSNLPSEAKDDFNDLALPQIVWDLQNPYIEQLNVSKLIKEWKDLRKEVGDGLYKSETRFQEVCLEFGVTRGPEATPSTGRRLFSYDHDYTEKNIVKPPCEEESPPHDKQEDTSIVVVEDCDNEDAEIDVVTVDPSTSKISSSFL